MANEVNELTELLNCIRQFETDIKSENDEVENWRQCLIIDEQKAKKLTKVKQGLQCTLRNSKLEILQIQEKVRKAKKKFDYCNKQVAEYTAAIEVARCEQNEMEQENKDFDEMLAKVKVNVIESILKSKIQLYKQIQEEKKKIDDKLRLLDGIKDLCQDDVSAAQIPNDMLIPFTHSSLEI